MPYVQAFPSWVALNNADFDTESGLVDAYTGQPYTGGALNLGDYCDYTDAAAAAVSYTKNGTLFQGRYRYVQVDSGATAANVKTGTVGYVRNGSKVVAVDVTNAGTGATPGSYQINATPGSGAGTGAIINVIVGASGTITSATVVQGGYGYVSVPSFSLTATGTSGGAVAAQLNPSMNLVTSADQVAAGTATAVRPVVFLNSITPGNYGFVQELGTATVLGNGTIGTITPAPPFVNAVPSNNGTVSCTAGNGSPLATSLGLAVDTPLASNLFKVLLQYVPVIED